MTSILGLLGHPLGHSVSVPMHMASIFTLGIDYVYLSFDILPEDLSRTVAGFKKEGVQGFNVTIPYKESIMSYLDGIDEHAGKIGAVNTVHNDHGKLKGYNTDGIGYITSLREQTGFSPGGRHVLMIGAGGAARAVAFSLLEAGIEGLIIANRSVEMDMAERLANHIKLSFPDVNVQALPVERIPWIPARELDLIINTTPVGMKHTGQQEIKELSDLMQESRTLLREDTVISDVIYNPVETPLLKMAKLAGLKTHNGINMLVYQGAESFRIWTGIRPPVDVMRRAVLQALQENR